MDGVNDFDYFPYFFFLCDFIEGFLDSVENSLVLLLEGKKIEDNLLTLLIEQGLDPFVEFVLYRLNF